MKKQKTLFVSFWAGPCTGKSTFTAELFARLKWNKIHAEVIDEYAKQMVWEELFPKLKNQIYIFAKQHKKQLMLDGKIEVAITDSALPLVLMYDKGKTKYLREIVLSEFNKFNNLNIFLKRNLDPENYTQVGRAHTFEEAKQIDQDILDFLNENEIEFIEVDAVQDNIEYLVTLIKEKLNK